MLMNQRTVAFFYVLVGMALVTFPGVKAELKFLPKLAEVTYTDLYKAVLFQGLISF
jgi:hypothetical protein